MTSALQEWAEQLTIMQQSVLMSAIRGPDGLRKDHPVKVLMRWYRRSLLLSAFEGRAFTDPFEPGGGSFTGPFTKDHAAEFGIDAFDEIRGVYLRHVDEIPHHFQLHLMHAAQIVGYKHNFIPIRIWWNEFYEMVVNDAHLLPETEEMMDKRLGDRESDWRAREVVTAV